MLRFYHTSVSGANVLSYGGRWNAFDQAEVDGTNGESSQRKLFLAPAQTLLTEAMSASSSGTIENIRIDHAVFESLQHLIILIDSEKLLIITGAGGLVLSVQRGYDSTTAASHAAGATVVNCYDYQAVTLGRTGANASRLTLAEDSGGSPGSFVSSLSAGTIAYNGSYTFWRDITVAAGTGKARDLASLPTLSCTAFEALKAA